MLRGNDPSDRDNALQLLDRALITAQQLDREALADKARALERTMEKAEPCAASPPTPHSSAFTRPTTGSNTALPTLRLQRGTRGLLAAIGTQCDHHTLRIDDSAVAADAIRSDAWSRTTRRA
jgi:hypothetical protein